MFRAIGVIDSGRGGETVLKALVALMPEEKFIYMSDRVNMPWGNKSKAFVTERCLAMTNSLVKQEVKCVVIACHTASAQTLDTLGSEVALPIFGMVEPTKRAISTMGRQVGLIASEATIGSGVYRGRTIYSKACPRLASLVENSKVEGAEVEEIVRQELRGMDRAKVLILGCTHYPFLAKVIGKVLPSTLLFNPAWAVARDVKRALKQKNLLGGAPSV